MKRFLPILDWLPRYKRESIRPDAIAALSVWALLVPQSLAYAGIAGVPVQYGLYAAFMALLGYAIFGTSRQLVTGPSAAVAAVSATAITGIVGVSAFGTQEFVPWTAALAITTGLIYFALGAARMGWVSNFLSKAVMAGFVLGFAIGIIIDQSHKLLGVPGPDGTYIQILVETIKEIPETNLTTLAVGTISLVALLLMKHFFKNWPRALIVVVVSILAVKALDLTAEGVAVTGPVPTGMFSISVPNIDLSEVAALVTGAFAVIFVGYSETLAAAREKAAAYGYRIDANQELVAQGAANTFSGLAGGFVVDGSLSKSSVADTAGQKTQMASLINAVMVLLTLLVLASVFEDLPSATLGAVVIDAMLGMVSFASFRRYYRVNRSDWVFFMGAALGILFFGIIQGIVTGVVLSLLLLVWRSSKPGIRELGWSAAQSAYLDPKTNDDAKRFPGVIAIRVDGPMFFADATMIKDAVVSLVESADDPVQLVVMDADAISQTDTDGADALIDLCFDLRNRGTKLALARVEQGVLELWKRAGVLEAIGDQRAHDTVHAAVRSELGDSVL